MLATHLHLSRAVTRRAERFICELLEDYPDQEYDRSIGIYLNRYVDIIYDMDNHIVIDLEIIFSWQQDIPVMLSKIVKMSYIKDI